MSKRRSALKGLLRRIGGLLFAFVMVTLLVSCSGVESNVRSAEAPVAPQLAEEHEFTIGLLFSSLYNPLYVSLQKGAVESASRLDVELIVREAGNSAEKQLVQIEELLALGVDAFVLNPVDSAAVSAGVRLAENANVPVITVERHVNGAAITAHVASDNVAGGEMAASYLVEMLQEEGTIVELMGSSGTSAAQDRSSGFNRMLARFPGITMAARAGADFDKRQAKRVFAEILEQHPDVDGVFAHNDAMILGAIEAAEEAGRADQIIFVGFDGSSEAIDALEDGTLAATVAQQPTEMGRIAVELAVDQLRGEDVTQNVAVSLALVTR